ncbi:MAG: hypothetical protein JW963_18050 [Anaerolineales bacterium]|nr:hypothetical protein [Anaerolineales bacterium]
MPISISEYIGVDWETFAKTGAFDAVLDVDSKLFIDPQLLKHSEAPELQDSYTTLSQRFAEIMKLLSHSKRYGDSFWRQAWRLFPSREVKGLCIGYSASGTSGTGIGKRLRGQILSTAKEIVDAGVQDPEIFELMGLLEEGIGADRISDMVASMIIDDLLAYSRRVFAELSVTRGEWTFRDRVYTIPINPFNRHPVILVPKDILRDLPIANSWSDVDIVARYNAQLRHKVNAIIGESWKEAVRVQKRVLRETLIREPDLMHELVELYKSKPATRYDFENDPAGLIIWYRASKQFTENYPLELALPHWPTAEAVLEVVMIICNRFKGLVEDNGLHRLLYERQGGNPKNEEAAQLLFFGIADAYCAANNLDLSREPNAGRGPVDFKISSGYGGRVLVETKLTTNTRLLHGFETQLEEYQKAEKTRYSVYLIIDVDRGSRKRIRELNELVLRQVAGSRIPEIVFVNGRWKASASRYALD